MMEEEKARNALALGTEIDARIQRSGEQAEQPRARARVKGQEEELLPGLPIELTLDQIVPKLSWRVFHILSSVSRAWHTAIRSRQVYDARIRFQSTETLVVLNHSPSKHVQALALYSMGDQSFYQLPQFPISDKGIPKGCQCISVDGKVYVLGGGQDISRMREVYVLDLAEHREWRQCASMKEPRRNFGCGIKDGKIYVFGGIFLNYKRECEVYDPKLDAWASIMPMKHKRCGTRVTTFGEEMMVYGGHVDTIGDPGFDKSYNVDVWSSNTLRDAFFLEVYQPGNNEWRLVKPFRKMNSQILFTGQGKLWKIDRFGRLARNSDIDKDTWVDVFGPSFYASFLHAVHATNDELLAIVKYDDMGHICLIQSEWCGSENEGSEHEEINNDEGELEWEILSCPVSFEHLGTCLISCIEL